MISQFQNLETSSLNDLNREYDSLFCSAVEYLNNEYIAEGYILYFEYLNKSIN